MTFKPLLLACSALGMTFLTLSVAETSLENGQAHINQLSPGYSAACSVSSTTEFSLNTDQFEDDIKAEIEEMVDKLNENSAFSYTFTISTHSRGDETYIKLILPEEIISEDGTYFEDFGADFLPGKTELMLLNVYIGDQVYTPEQAATELDWPMDDLKNYFWERNFELVGNTFRLGEPVYSPEDMAFTEQEFKAMMIDMWYAIDPQMAADLETLTIEDLNLQFEDKTLAERVAESETGDELLVFGGPVDASLSMRMESTQVDIRMEIQTYGELDLSSGLITQMSDTMSGYGKASVNNSNFALELRLTGQDTLNCIPN